MLFKSVPLGWRGFPDMIPVGTSPLVPRCTEELFFSPDTGTGFVSVGVEVSRLNEELLLPSGTGTKVGRLLELALFSSDTYTGFVSVGLDVSMLNEELLLPSETEIEVGSCLDWVSVSPVPTPSEVLLSLTEIETTFDEAVGFLDEPSGVGGAVAMDTSPPSEGVAETDEGVERVVKDGLKGGSVGVTEELVTFWIECCRRKRTRMAVSLWIDTLNRNANILIHPCHLQTPQQRIPQQRM